MSKLKCLKDSKTNAYIIPTHEWLQPIKPLITESSDAQQIIAKMLDKEEILVRLTNNYNNKLGFINKKLQNFPLVYCTIICNESSDLLNVDYIIDGKPFKGFCNGKSSDGYITIELMKYYKNNKNNKLTNNKIDLKSMKYLLDQSLSAQLIAFQIYGFIHNDININNFIFEKLNDKEYEYSYAFDKRLGFEPVTGKLNYKVYVIDFGESELLDPQYRSQYIRDYYVCTNNPNIPKLTNPKYINSENTLPNNLFETIKAFLNLCPNYTENLNKINKITIESNQILDFYNYKYNKLYFTMCRLTNDFDMFMYKVLGQSIRMINEYYMVLFNQPFVSLDYSILK
jgi:hypothetical protein